MIIEQNKTIHDKISMPRTDLDLNELLSSTFNVWGLYRLLLQLRVR